MFIPSDTRAFANKKETNRLSHAAVKNRNEREREKERRHVAVIPKGTGC